MQLEERQRVAVYGLLLVEHRVLVARGSAACDWPGLWFLPGGGLEFGETPEQCVVREFQEESGLTVRAADVRHVLTEVTDLPQRCERLHTVRVIYDVELLGGDLRPESDGTTDLVEWHPLHDALALPLMPFVREVLTARVPS